MDMVTMNFPVEAMKLTVLNKAEEILAELKESSNEKATPEKIKSVYDELFFPASPENRPYTFGSIVLSMDGKMAYEDDPQGPLIAAKNLLDLDGGLGDFWILNVLRAYADGVIIGAGTLAAEPLMISNCFDQDLVDARFEVLGKKTVAPMNIVVSFDGTDIPLEHGVFSTEGLAAAIATSPDGGDYLKTNFKNKHIIFGPYANTEEVDIAEIKKKMASDEKAIPIFLTGKGSNPDSAVLMYILKKIGLEKLVIESPSYMWHLMSIGAMDEMFINYSSVFVGGHKAPGAFHAFSVNAHPHSQILTTAMHKNNFIFTRQKLYYGLVEDEPVRDERTM
ncbi:dihydrofolate reductase family protein [Clostridia bacterium]|nr:dihydrofolate reductase family protein [Clostridia bacterium]